MKKSEKSKSDWTKLPEPLFIYSIEDIQIALAASMKVESGATLQLQDLQISRLGRVGVDVTGLGPVDWIVERVVDFVNDQLKVRTILLVLFCLNLM